MKFIKNIAPALMSIIVFSSIIGVIVWGILDDNIYEKLKEEECEKKKKETEEVYKKKWTYDCEKEDIVLNPIYEIVMLVDLPSKDTEITELTEIYVSNFHKAWDEEIENRKLQVKNHKEDIEKKQNKEYLEKKVADYALWLEAGLKTN